MCPRQDTWHVRHSAFIVAFPLKAGGTGSPRFKTPHKTCSLQTFIFSTDREAEARGRGWNQVRVTHSQVEGGIRSGFQRVWPSSLLGSRSDCQQSPPGAPASPELGTPSQLSLQRVSCSLVLADARLILHSSPWQRASQVILMVKNPLANAGDVRYPGSIPGLGRSPAGGHGNPLQYSSLENRMDRGASWATVHR